MSVTLVIKSSKLCFPLLACVVSVAAIGNETTASTTVYKTVDPDGVVSFSDTPPETAVPVETMVIETDTTELSESAQDQLAAIRETTDRMVADRQAREKHRAELRQQRLEDQAQPQVVEYSDSVTYGGVYNRYYPYPVYRPFRKHRPVHPIHPPLRPHQPIKKPPNVISPGHNYPASLIRRSYSPQVRAAFER